jgi:hypothetical protein
MGFNPLTAERGLKSTTRWLHQGTWLLLLSGAGLIFVVRGSAGRTGVLWILGCALLGLVLSLALRDVLRKLGRRNTEDKLVKDVKVFLEGQPADETAPPKPARATAIPAPDPPGALGSSQPADFVPLSDVAPDGAPAGLPVVFDVFPRPETFAFKKDFHAVVAPVKPN